MGTVFDAVSAFGVTGDLNGDGMLRGQACDIWGNTDDGRAFSVQVYWNPSAFTFDVRGAVEGQACSPAQAAAIIAAQLPMADDLCPPDDIPLHPDDQDRIDAIRLASERNPDVAFFPEY